LIRLEPPFDRAEKLAILPPGWRLWATRSWLLSRLLRLDVFRMVQTSKGTLFATSAQGIMRCTSGSRRFSVAFRDYLGARPLALCVDGDDRVYFGEYFNNPDRREVQVYMSEDDGDTWSACYTFPPRSIRHVHGLVYDASRRAIWVLTGDYGNEAQIGLATPGFTDYRVVAQGSQQTRALAGVPTETGLVYATDTPLEQNHVYALDADSGAIRSVAQVQQSVFFMTRGCSGLWLSTVVEPSAVLPTQAVHVWYSPEGEQWTELFSAQRDRWSLRYFQYPAVFFAQAPRECPYVFLSIRGARGFDGDCLIGEVTA
jgi:hypothetical protein